MILDFDSLVRIMSGDTIPEKDRLSARLVHVILSIVTCQGKHFVMFFVIYYVTVKNMFERWNFINRM